ncbi:hypothetical protein [Listeria valentina]|uniref:hypothetical protein n=1 Tax=Listeria valentina TaxID=2705293 RepID=UPI00142F739F|nr:hypothetical protein [Listeria valentina]
MKKGIMGAILVPSLVLSLAGCGEETTDKKEASKEKSTVVHKQPKKEKKISFSLADFTQTMEKTMAEIIYLDNMDGNIGYNIQEGMNRDTYGFVQELSNEFLDKRYTAIHKESEEGMRKFERLGVDPDLLKKYKEAYQYVLDTVQKQRAIILTLNETNGKEVRAQLDQSFDQPTYMENSQKMALLEVEMAIKAGYKKEEAQKAIQEAKEKVMEKYGDPVDLAKLREQ